MGCDGDDKVDGFTATTSQRLARSLGQRLIRVVDRARDVNTRLGLRPYNVWIVRTRFAGGARGRGVEQLVYEQQILPTPLVVDMSTLSQSLTPIGTNEMGSVQLQQISGRYTEETLMGVGPDGAPVPSNESLFYEIEFFRRDGRPAIRRRFDLDDVPWYDASKFEWHLTLISSVENRGRDRTPGG